MRLALYQPDIPQNTGAMMRLSVCFGVGIDIIEPCGFALDDKKLHRVSMDYIRYMEMERHKSWEAFLEKHSVNKLVLLSTKSDLIYTDFSFQPDDILLVGRESEGVPKEIHETVKASVCIPMNGHARSLNVAQAAAIVLAESFRQTHQFVSGKKDS